MESLQFPYKKATYILLKFKQQTTERCRKCMFVILGPLWENSFQNAFFFVFLKLWNLSGSVHLIKWLFETKCTPEVLQYLSDQMDKSQKQNSTYSHTTEHMKAPKTRDSFIIVDYLYIACMSFKNVFNNFCCKPNQIDDDMMSLARHKGTRLF